MTTQTFNEGDFVLYTPKDKEELYPEECKCTFVNMIDETTCNVRKNTFGQVMTVDVNRLTMIAPRVKGSYVDRTKR